MRPLEQPAKVAGRPRQRRAGHTDPIPTCNGGVGDEPPPYAPRPPRAQPGRPEMWGTTGTSPRPANRWRTGWRPSTGPRRGD